jgi:uncharacterized OB-fold protein
VNPLETRMADWTQGEPRIVVTSCVRCGNHWYLPHVLCPVCGNGDTDQAAAVGAGLCVAVSRVHVTTDAESGPVVLVLVELDEGPVVMGRSHDDGLAPGDRASVGFRPDGDEQALVPSFARERTTHE